MKKALIFMMFVLILGGCQANEELHGPTGDIIADEDSVVVTVNGEEIYQSQVSQVISQAQMQGEQIESSIVIERLVNMEILLQEANRLNISVSVEEAEENLRELLAMEGAMTLEDIKGQMGPMYQVLLDEQKQQLKVQKLAKEKGNVTVTEEEVKQFYEKNTEIMGGRTFEEARAEIRMVLEQQKMESVLVDVLTRLRERADISYN